MSLRADTSSLISGALVVGDRGLGVLGSEVPSTGDSGAGYLYNDLSLPGDASKEVRGLITSQPSAGTLYAYEDSSFTFTGAPDGTYSFGYQLYVDGASTGSPATVTLTVGSGSSSVTLTLADAAHAHTADNVVLSEAPYLTIADALHGHTAGTPSLVTDTWMGVADGGHAHVADNITLQIPVDGAIARPVVDTTSGSWLPSTGATLYGCIDEATADDTDYIYANSATTCQLALSSVANPGTTSGQVVSYRVWSPSGNGLVVRLKCGSATVATWTHATLPVTVTQYDQSLSAGEIAAITDYADLRVEFEST